MCKMEGMKFVLATEDNSDYKYYIESVDREERDVLIKGWVIAESEVPVEVELVNADKKSISDGNVWRKTRIDVRNALNVNDDFNAEFLIRFDRENVPGDVVYVHFKGENAKDMYLGIDVKKLDFSLTSLGKVVGFLGNSPIKNTIRHIKNKNNGGSVGNTLDEMYAKWRKDNNPTASDYEKQRNTVFEYQPLISISIPLYNTRIDFFKPIMDAVLGQTYSNFELCLADGSDNDYLGKYIEKNYPDDRIKYVKLEENLGIAGNTNVALKMATGDYVMLADHDDLLEIDALYEIVKALNEDPTLDIIYTDEDLVDEKGTFFSDFKFKPDFNLEMLRHRNYICHIFVARKSIMDEVGGFREEYDGAQDFDMILRCCEKSDRIYHIPKVLYHWRSHMESTAGNADSKRYAVDASVHALQEHYKRVGIEADVEATDIFIILKTTRKIKEEELVSIIIQSKDNVDVLDKCIRSIVDKTTYSNYEIIVVENNSTEEETFQYYDKISEELSCVKVVRWEHEFNFSKINNFGARHASGRYYVLLNNDIEVISPDWLNRMVGYCQDESIGAVGAKLLYPDDTVQHCGVVVGIAGFAGHVFNGLTRQDLGYFGRLIVQQEVSAVTAACMMVDANVFNEIGGLDEEFAVALNDVDLCLNIRDKGKKIILDPNILMYHYESKSRGTDEAPEKINRFKSEIKRFRDKWKKELEEGDPYYSPNLTLDRLDCTPRRLDEKFTLVEEIEQGENK